MARHSATGAIPLAIPQPFHTGPAAFTTQNELLMVLRLIDALPDIDGEYDATFVAHAIAEEVALCEPTATHLAHDVVIATATGAAIHRLTAHDPGFATAPNEVRPLVAHTIAWAAMEHAADAPERHGPWIAFATQVGFVIAKQGDALLRHALANLAAWRGEGVTMTHSAYSEQRLVLDIGRHPDGSIVARNYLPLRPAGIERAHDTLLFETACDNFTERAHGKRVHGTTRLPNVFPLHWKTLT